MKAVILAGGFGTRLSEETELKPKPMVEIGGWPILWHIMKIFAAYDVTDFVICLGYKGYIIKEYFLNYRIHMSDITVKLADGAIEFHRTTAEDWNVTLVDTGESTMTGGRLKRVKKYLDDRDFFLTYGDGLSDIDLKKLAAFHHEHGRLATVTAVAPPGRFGALEFAGDRIMGFREKPTGDGGTINGGFFVLSPRVIDYIAGDDTIWEQEPLEALAVDGELYGFQHRGFWHPMDTLRDKHYLNNLWSKGAAPWKVW